MNRETLITRLEHSMFVIGNGMHKETMGYTEYSPAQKHVLMVVGMHGKIGIKQLAEMLNVTSGAVTQHVDTLEKAGLFMRETSSNDRREVVVQVTDKGQDTFQEISRRKTQILSEIFGQLNDADLRVLVNLIEKVGRKYIKNNEEAHATVQ